MVKGQHCTKIMYKCLVAMLLGHALESKSVIALMNIHTQTQLGPYLLQMHGLIPYTGDTVNLIILLFQTSSFVLLPEIILNNTILSSV